MGGIFVFESKTRVRRRVAGFVRIAGFVNDHKINKYGRVEKTDFLQCAHVYNDGDLLERSIGTYV